MDTRCVVFAAGFLILRPRPARCCARISRRGRRFEPQNKGASMPVFLGIDIGTSGTKTLAINERGKILADAMECYDSYFPKPLWSEQDPEDWWQATVKTVRAAVKKAKVKPAD